LARPPKGLALSLVATPGVVTLISASEPDEEVELDFTPAQARELARDLLELADDAEARRG
jgi:hypothetical protein